MILINWLLALGALAFTVPLTIHLLFRNRFEVVDWAAMRFLRAVVQQNRRRVRLRNLLLLLIRCAIPVLLAFCLAKPVLTGWQQPRGDSPVAMVLILDNSYSSAVRIEDRSRFETSIATALEITRSLGRGSEITVLTSDGLSRSSDPAGIANRLAEIEVGGGPLALESLLGRALRVVAESSFSTRQIVLITGQTASDYSRATLDALPGIAERIAAISPPPEVDWVDPFGEPREFEMNLRLHRVEPATEVSVVGQSVPWFVEARIDGDSPRRVEFRLSVHGATDVRQSVEVRGGTASTVIPLVAERVGKHVAEVSVSVADGEPGTITDQFTPDDRIWQAFRVLDPIDVWLVDGKPSAEPLAGDTDFLAVALNPFSLAGGEPTYDGGDLFRTQKVRSGRLAETRTEEGRPSVVVLADVARPPLDDCRWLTDFVQDEGGTLVVFGGPSIDPAWYHEQLSAAATGPLLPLRFGATVSAESGATIDDARLTYPPLAVFSGREQGTLAAATVQQWLELLPHDGDQAGESQVVLRLEGGEPLMAVRSVGRGRVLQVATTANGVWNTLPLRPVFVPLIQRLLAFLTVDGEFAASVAAGQPITLLVDSAGSRWSVTTPDGRTQRLIAADAQDVSAARQSQDEADREVRISSSAGDELQSAGAKTGRLVWQATNRAGAYRFTSEDGEAIWAAVNVPAADLRPTLADVATRRAAAERLAARYHESLDAFLVDDSNRRFGRGIWQYLLIAVLAALILEPVVQQRRLSA